MRVGIELAILSFGRHWKSSVHYPEVTQALTRNCKPILADIMSRCLDGADLLAVSSSSILGLLTDRTIACGSEYRHVLIKNLLSREFRGKKVAPVLAHGHALGERKSGQREYSLRQGLRIPRGHDYSSSRLRNKLRRCSFNGHDDRTTHG